MSKRKSQRAGVLAMVVVATAFAASNASASGGTPGADADSASRALQHARAALDPAPGAPGGPTRDVTAAMRDLALAVPDLDGRERRQAVRLLARPTDNPDPNRDTWAVPEEPPFCSAHFCVHYVASTPDAPNLADGNVNGVPDYVEAVSAAAEHSFSVQNGALGWPAPRSDGGLGGPGGVTDIYLANVGDEKIFGYAAPDPPPAQRCARKCFSYLVLDNDFSPAEYGYPDPGIPLRVTLAHEYNHVLQFGIDAIQDGWLFESTAVWAEEKTFPDDNDYLNYLGRFAKTSVVPITDFSGGGGLRVYGLATFLHWLDGNFGPAVVLGSWLNSTRTKPKDFAVASVDRSIRERGGNGFAAEFSQFAAASAEWRTAGGFPDAAAYPDVKRKGTLKRGQRPRRLVVDHTAYRLLNVKPSSRPRLKLRVRAERGVVSGIGLVGRDDDTGQVTRKVKVLRKGGRGSVTLRAPERFERITAAIVNADGRVRGFDPERGDWVYSRNNAEFRASVG
ncbi:MAG TPA: MXAN_6640 family putative metalloprotease [Solirubrobacterales bacterium]|nr:MXAN_6640 family putative metalloprotease [Solirubrobacterales bacterium]